MIVSLLIGCDAVVDAFLLKVVVVVVDGVVEAVVLVVVVTKVEVVFGLSGCR